MYDLEVIDVISFITKYTMINEQYKVGDEKFYRLHVLSLLSFLKVTFAPKENEKNDTEYLRLLVNLEEWLKNLKQWKKQPKISLRLPDNVFVQKWSNGELDMFSDIISQSISVASCHIWQSKHLTNPCGVVEWLINVLLQKYPNQHLKYILHRFLKDLLL
jgi:hypothetical protein